MKHLFYFMENLLWFFLLAAIGYVLLLCIAALFVRKKEYETENRFYRALLNSFTRLTVKFLRIRVHTSGMEGVPKDVRFLLVGNHRSNFDPILQWYVLHDRQMAFVSKKENFNIPVFGRIIRKCCFMAINRENPRDALQTVEKAAMLMRENRASVGIYPEGTRNKSGEELLPFRNGVFKIAQKSAAPIVVMALRGTEHIHENCPLKRTDVYLDVVDVLPAEYVLSHKTFEIGERVRESLASVLHHSELQSGGVSDETVLHSI